MEDCIQESESVLKSSISKSLRRKSSLRMTIHFFRGLTEKRDRRLSMHEHGTKLKRKWSDSAFRYSLRNIRRKSRREPKDHEIEQSSETEETDSNEFVTRLDNILSYQSMFNENIERSFHYPNSVQNCRYATSSQNKLSVTQTLPPLSYRNLSLDSCTNMFNPPKKRETTSLPSLDASFFIASKTDSFLDCYSPAFQKIFLERLDSLGGYNPVR